MGRRSEKVGNATRDETRNTLSLVDGKGYSWTVDVELILYWLEGLNDDTYDQVLAALRVLADYGPGLGRPLVDSITGSRHKNMKELRPGSSGRSEVRILFIFDPQRQAIMLLAGDKSGSWKTWYRTNIPIAESRYERHLARLEKKGRN